MSHPTSSSAGCRQNRSESASTVRSRRSYRRSRGGIGPPKPSGNACPSFSPATSRRFVRAGEMRISFRPASVVEPDIAHEVIVRRTIRADGIGGKIVVGIAHGDAGHNDLVLGNVSDFAHDIRAGDALSVDDAAEAAVPSGEHDAVAKRAEIEMTH